MKISTVALWSVTLWSSGAWASSAYAVSEPDHTDPLPLPNLSSEQEATLPFVSLETLPTEGETAIALESSLADQEVIEWSPALESSTVVHTLELDAVDVVAELPTDGGMIEDPQTGLEQNAIAAGVSDIPVIPEVTPSVEWSPAHAVDHSGPVVLADRALEGISETAPTAGLEVEDRFSTADIQWDAVDPMADVNESQTTELDNLVAPSSGGTAAFSENWHDGNGEQALAAGIAQPTSNDEAMVALSTVAMTEMDGAGLTASKVFDIAQLSSASFPDIASHWARGFIEPLAVNGVVEGFPNGTFQPDATLTRAEFAALLDQSFVLSPIRSSPDFRDVPANHWANEAIDSAYRSGFISGQSNTQFAPEQSLTRADTLTALANGLSLTSSNSAAPLSSYFDDANQIPAYARNAIAAAVENEMVVNFPQVRFFRPNAAATRAEAAAFLHQALAHLDAVPDLSQDIQVAQYIVQPEGTVPSGIAETPDPQTVPADVVADVRQSLEGILDSLETEETGRTRNSSPGITISNPSGFGADNFTGFASFSYQSRTRFGNEDDGTLGFGVGFGDSTENVGFQLSYSLASFGSSRDFGTGGFNAKLHRQLPGRWGVALGWDGFLNIGDENDFEGTVYGAASKIFEVRDDVTQPFSRISLTAGVGNGRFRLEEDFQEGNDTFSPFGSASFLLAPPVTSIVEWTGQDLAVGLSIAPFRDFPLVISPAVRDIAGAGDGARFVISSGVSWKF